MTTPTKKILKAIDLIVEMGLESSAAAVCRKIGMQRSNYYNLKKQDETGRNMNFTMDQLEVFFRSYPIDANYIFGTSKEIIRKDIIKNILSKTK